MSAFDAGSLVGKLKLITPALGSSLLIHEAIVGEPTLTLTIDGASTLTIPLDDTDRKLLASEALTTRSWATVGGINFELVKAAKGGDGISLTFEDAIAAALRREKGKRRWASNSATRREIIAQVCKAAEVKCLVDPDKRPKVKSAVERGPKNDGWALTGSLASDIQWRRFSNGKRLIAGGDKWLLARQDKPTKIRENSGPWGSLDFDLDVGKRSQSLTTTVTAEEGIFQPGDVFEVADDYPATEGRWLLSEYRHRLTTPFVDLTFVRPTKTLKEPKGTGGGDDGESGTQNYLPDVGGDPGAAGSGHTATTSSSNPARERMTQFALAQNGDAYVWGGNGPSGWDCSGLVEGATAAAGKRLAGASATQWSTCVAAGVTIPVATALRTRGALLFRINSGEYNHVAISLGNGSTIEAMGSAYGVLVAGGAASRTWTGAALWI